MKLILKAREGLVPKKVTVSHGGKTYQQTVYVRAGKKPTASEKKFAKGAVKAKAIITEHKDINGFVKRLIEKKAISRGTGDFLKRLHKEKEYSPSVGGYGMSSELADKIIKEAVGEKKEGYKLTDKGIKIRYGIDRLKNQHTSNLSYEEDVGDGHKVRITLLGESKQAMSAGRHNISAGNVNVVITSVAARGQKMARIVDKSKVALEDVEEIVRKGFKEAKKLRYNKGQ